MIDYAHFGTLFLSRIRLNEWTKMGCQVHFCSCAGVHVLECTELMCTLLRSLHWKTPLICGASCVLIKFINPNRRIRAGAIGRNGGTSRIIKNPILTLADFTENLTEVQARWV